MKHYTPVEAHELMQNDPNVLLIDCRTEIEYFYVGHPVRSINIEWHRGVDFSVNPEFVHEVLQVSGTRHRPLMLICRSGKRTLEAGAALEAAGFTDVSHVLEGFEGELDKNFHRGTLGGWRKAGLPWEQL